MIPYNPYNQQPAKRRNPLDSLIALGTLVAIIAIIATRTTLLDGGAALLAERGIHVTPPAVSMPGVSIDAPSAPPVPVASAIDEDTAAILARTNAPAPAPSNNAVSAPGLASQQSAIQSAVPQPAQAFYNYPIPAPAAALPSMAEPAEAPAPPTEQVAAPPIFAMPTAVPQSQRGPSGNGPYTGVAQQQPVAPQPAQPFYQQPAPAPQQAAPQAPAPAVAQPVAPPAAVPQPAQPFYELPAPAPEPAPAPAVAQPAPDTSPLEPQAHCPFYDLNCND